MAIEDVTAVEEPFFKIVKSNDEVKMLPYHTRIFMTIQLDDEVTLIERNVYNLLTLFGDVGGL